MSKTLYGMIISESIGVNDTRPVPVAAIHQDVLKQFPELAERWESFLKTLEGLQYNRYSDTSPEAFFRYDCAVQVRPVRGQNHIFIALRAGIHREHPAIAAEFDALAKEIRMAFDAAEAENTLV